MKMKKWIVALLAMTLAVGILAGCGKVNSLASPAMRTAETYAAEAYSADMMMVDMAAGEAPAPLAAQKNAGSTPTSLPANRKWIITMSLNAETDDMDAALQAINAQINAMGGYVENQNVNSNASQRRRSANLTIRIPAEQVDSFVTEVSGVTNVTSNSRYVQDITLVYSDTEGRVNALKAEETRLLELMAKAEKMSDLLEIEERLTEVRYQLESYSSSLRLYDNQIDYATVDLYITEVQKYTPVEEPGFWKKITSGLGDSIVDLFKNIVDVISWIIVELPYLIVWGLIIWGIVVVVMRIVRKHKKAKKEEEKK